MEINSTVEIVRCPYCNSIVPKQLYCRKCGYVLLNATPITLSEQTKKTEKNTANPYIEPAKIAAKDPEISAYEQLQQIRREAKIREDARQSKVESPAQVEKEILRKNIGIETPSPSVEKIFSEPVIKDVKAEIIEPLIEEKIISKEEKVLAQKNEPKIYMPDLYVKEIVEKMAKSVKYEVNLVQLLHEGQMTEEIFTRLFNGMADETHGLITRREEVMNELNSLMKGYESTVVSAQQGMKLLELRKSIGDASDEEYGVKSAALNWDIKHYGNKIVEGRQRADYLSSLGKLIPEDEVKDLHKVSAECSEDVSSINVSKSTQERIKKAMEEATSILSDIYKK